MVEYLGTGTEWVDAMRDTTRALARAQYAHVETVTGFYRRGVAADLARSGGWHHADEGAAATAVAAVMMRMSEYAVSELVDVGLALDGLPHTKAAFGVGDLDLARVRAIVDVTTGCHQEARVELDRRLATLGATCAVPGLRATGRRWAAKLDPASAAERRKRTVEDRDVRVRAARDGMAILDGWLPVEAAQTVAHRLADMARDEVCAQDPRTFPQRRADALTALADGTGRLVCGCNQGADCPKAGTDPTTATPAARVVVQVGVSLETLLGLRDWPGYLAGAGAIDADLARTLAQDGRWEWIIAAIDTAATMTSPDTANCSAGVPDRGEAATDITGSVSTEDGAKDAGGRADVAGGSADADADASVGPVDRVTREPSAPDPARATGRAFATAAGRPAAPPPGGAATTHPETAAGQRSPDAADSDENASTATTSDDPGESEQTVDRTDEPDTATASGARADVSGETAREHGPAGDGPDSGPPPDPDPESGNDSSPQGSRRRRSRMSAAARKAIAAACMARIGGWDDPDTAAALRYAWPESLARWIRARDLICRFPNCRVPARNCDIDHTIRYDHSDPRNGGRTIRTNAACLCRAHHRLKTDGEDHSGGWRVQQTDGRGRLAWTSPSGEVIITDPEGAEYLWPEPDLIITPPPSPRLAPEDGAQLRARGEVIAKRYGLELTDTTTIASRYDETAEYYEFLSAAYPRRDGNVIDVDTSAPDDEPPPF